MDDIEDRYTVRVKSPFETKAKARMMSMFHGGRVIKGDDGNFYILDRNW